jgi:hypothetical protein
MPQRAPSAEAQASGEARMRQIYADYVASRRATGEPTAGISYEKLAQTLQAQGDKLRREHGAHRRVDFEVVQQGGKTMIRPVVK